MIGKVASNLQSLVILSTRCTVYFTEKRNSGRSSAFAQCRKFLRIQKHGLHWLCAMPQILTDPKTWSSLLMRNAAHSLRIQKHGLFCLCAMPQILTDPETWSWGRLHRAQWAPWCRRQHTSPAPAHDTCSVKRTVLRIRDVYPGSPIRVFFHPGSWVQGGKKKKICYLTFLNFFWHKFYKIKNHLIFRTWTEKDWSQYNLIIFKLKKFKLSFSENMGWIGDPRSRKTYPGSGSRGQKSTDSRIRIQMELNQLNQ